LRFEGRDCIYAAILPDTKYGEKVREGSWRKIAQRGNGKGMDDRRVRRWGEAGIEQASVDRRCDK